MSLPTSANKTDPEPYGPDLNSDDKVTRYYSLSQLAASVY